MAVMTGLSGNEIYCLHLQGMTPGDIVVGNSVFSMGFLGGIGGFGPTLLGLYGSWGLSGGPLFRVAGKPRGAQPKDRIRMVVNFTYWF